MSKKKMLIVDDIAMNRTVLAEFFKDEFDITQADDGQEAYNILKTEQIRIVISDIYMPHMNGLELTKKIRQTPEISDTIVFLITDRGESFELQALEAGADDFINKPFHMELLKHRINGVLSQDKVANRVSQYQLSFNENQIPFATVLSGGARNEEPVFQYVNEAFAQLLDSKPVDFIKGTRKLSFDGFDEFIYDVVNSKKRNTATFKDYITGRYFDITAYAQEKGFCSFILIENETARFLNEEEKRYDTEFDNLLTVNPNTMGAIFVNLDKNVCIKGYGSSSFFDRISFPMEYTVMIDILKKRAVTDNGRKQFEEFCDADRLNKLYAQGKRNFAIEVATRMLNESIHWIGVYIKLSRNPITNELNGVLYSIDIHSRKLSQLVLTTLVKKDFDVVSCIDMNVGIIQNYIGSGSNAWSEAMPLSVMEELIDEDIKKHYTDDDIEEFINKNRISVVGKWMKDRQSYEMKFSLMADDGKKHLYKGSYYWVDETRNLLCFTREDITDVIEKEQKINEKLKKVNEELMAASNAKMEFLSRMSHDIRTPMNAIIGITALAFDEINNPDAIKEYLTKISSASHFLLGLVNDILDMEKIESGSMELHPEPYSYTEFLENLSIMFQPLCNKNGVNFEFEKVTTSLSVMADKVRVNQIFFNILSNAVKFTPEGGTISYYTENIKQDETSISCDYIIKDTGIGMSQEFQENMFSAFSQENTNLTSNIQGTGLGLAITKRLVDLMGGTIEIKSAQGKGTTVRIHLSFLLADDKKTKDIEKTNKSDDSSASLNGKSVLLVEDHPLNMEIAKSLLEKKGIQVYTAENGLVALEQFENSTPGTFDAILMDIRMPVMDGITASKNIRALDRDDAKTIPIIAMTANAYDEDIRKTREAGMNEHLSKPVNVEKLYSVLTNMMK